MTGENLQVTLMSLNPGEDIGLERHEDTDQLLFVTSGDESFRPGTAGTICVSAELLREQEFLFLPGHGII